MDNTSIGEVSLEQIPKEFRPNKYQHKSPWAVIAVIIVAICFGIFYIVERREEEETPAPVVSGQTPPKQASTETPPFNTRDLEASVGSIDIPTYSDEI